MGPGFPGVQSLMHFGALASERRRGGRVVGPSRLMSSAGAAAYSTGDPGKQTGEIHPYHYRQLTRAQAVFPPQLLGGLLTDGFGGDAISQCTHSHCMQRI
jgi:hypothetical protein